MKLRFSILILLLLCVLAGCNKAALAPVVAPDATAWPTTDWLTSAPEQQGVDAEKLSRLNSVIAEKGLELDSLLIVRHGVIVFEEYYGQAAKDLPHIQYSVTKSIISTLVGIAIDQGKIKGVDERVVDLLPGRAFTADDPSKASITLENLLTMTSGLDWQEGVPAYSALSRSPDWAQYMLGLPMRQPPGEKFNYCSGCSHLLSAVLDQALDGKSAQFARKNLFDPLGIKDYHWEQDSQGILIGGWGLYLTTRDMAKLGYLYLHDGLWEDQQIVSASWVQSATQKHVSSGGRLGYGYQWWTYPNYGAYTALGKNGQTIFVVPNLDLIIVATANMPEGHDPIYDLIDHEIIPAVK